MTKKPYLSSGKHDPYPLAPGLYPTEDTGTFGHFPTAAIEKQSPIFKFKMNKNA